MSGSARLYAQKALFDSRKLVTKSVMNEVVEVSLATSSLAHSYLHEFKSEVQLCNGGFKLFSLSHFETRTYRKFV